MHKNKNLIVKPINKVKLAKRIAEKMGIHKLSILKESLMKCDLENNGEVNAIQFKASLRGSGAMLQDRDMKKLVSGYMIAGNRIGYRSFLNDAFGMC